MHHNAILQIVPTRVSYPANHFPCKGPEDVVMSHAPSFPRLDPFRAETVPPAPRFQVRPQADDVQERFLPAHAADGGPVIGVEVAMDRNAARLSKSDRLLDLPALEVALLAHARD